MDALRDRTTILHEDLAAQISEKIAVTSNRLTAVAAGSGDATPLHGGVPRCQRALGLEGRFELHDDPHSPRGRRFGRNSPERRLVRPLSGC